MQHRFTPDAVLLVAASEKYDSADYIRDYGEFLKLVKAPQLIPLNDFKRQWDDTREAAIAAFEAIGASGWYILGREVRDFEQALARLLGPPLRSRRRQRARCHRDLLESAGLRARR